MSSNGASYDDSKGADRVTIVGGTSALYVSSATTITAGAATSLFTDVNGDLLVSLNTLIAGEDLTNNVLKVENRYSYGTLLSSTTIAVKSGAGFLHSLYVGSISCPSTTIWDNTVPSGTVIAKLPVNAPVGAIPLNVSFATGLTIDSVGGSAPSFTVSYR